MSKDLTEIARETAVKTMMRSPASIMSTRYRRFCTTALTVSSGGREPLRLLSKMTPAMDYACNQYNEHSEQSATPTTPVVDARKRTRKNAPVVGASRWGVTAFVRTWYGECSVNPMPIPATSGYKTLETEVRCNPDQPSVF